VIAQAYLNEWVSKAPWPQQAQVEQDLVLSRLIVEAAPDGVGGAWVLGAETVTSESQSYAGLTHMNASGAIEHVTMPNGLLPDSIKLGTDGNARLLWRAQ
jgi:hypothetical protein